jgi:hypothetical protein
MLVSCPDCKTENQTPTRTWKILDEPSSLGSFSERSVGIFQCSRCGMTFPHVVGRKQYMIVKAEEFMKMKDEIKMLNSEVNRIKEDADISELQASVSALEREVSELRKEKKELEVKLS